METAGTDLFAFCVTGVRLENGIYGHSRFCNTDFDDKLACLNLSG
ncbi:integrase, partial [Escherichia coli]|nr:integrase [Escherichia coli]